MNPRTRCRFFEGVGACLRSLAARTQGRLFRVLFACVTALALLAGGIVVFQGVRQVDVEPPAAPARGGDPVTLGAGGTEGLLPDLQDRWRRACVEELPDAPRTPRREEREAASSVLAALDGALGAASPAAPRDPVLLARAAALRATVLTEGLRRVRSAEEEVLHAIGLIEGVGAAPPREDVLAAWEEIAHAAERTTRLDEAGRAWDRAAELSRSQVPSRAARAEAALARIVKRRSLLVEAEERCGRLRREAWDALPGAAQAALLLDLGDIDRGRRHHALALVRHGEAAARIEEEGGGGSPLAALARRGRALAWIGLGKFDEAAKEAAAAAEALEATGCDIPAAQTRTTLALALIGDGRRAEAATSLAAAGAILEAASPGPEDVTRLFLGMESSLDLVKTRLAVADVDGAVDDVRRAARWRRLAGLGVRQVLFLQRIAEELAGLGHAAEAEEEVRAFLRNLGDANGASATEAEDAMRGRCELALAALEWMRGRLASAAGHVSLAQGRLRRGRDPAGEAEALLRGAAISAGLGMWSRVEAEVGAYREHTQASPRGRAIADALLARAALARGDAEGSAAAIGGAIARARSLGDSLLAGRFQLIEGTAFEAAGREADARASYREAAAVQDLLAMDLRADAILASTVLELRSGKGPADLVSGEMDRLGRLLEEPPVAAHPRRAWRLHFARGRALERRGDDSGSRDALALAAGTAESMLQDLSRHVPEEAMTTRIEPVEAALGDLLLEHLRRAGDGEGARRDACLAAWEALDRLRAHPIDAMRFEGERSSRMIDFPRDRLAGARLRLLLSGQDPTLEAAGQADVARELRAEILAAESEIRVRLRTRAVAPGPWDPRRQMEALGSGDALLATFLGAGESRVLVLRRDGAFTARIEPSLAEIVSRAGRLLDEVSGPGNDVDAAALPLSTALLHPAAPFIAGVERLWVSPDPQLAFVPFGLLRLPDGRRAVEAFEVSQLAAPRHLSRAMHPCTIHPRAPGGMTRDARPPLVAFTVEEAGLVARAFAGARVFAGARATEARLRAEACRGASLLIAARSAGGDAAAPLAGVITLAPGAGGASGEADDGRLTALEAADLDLRGVALAVLSGCQATPGSGSGREGALGLERAFLVAGARSVIATRWDPGEGATQRILVRVLDGIQSGLQPAAALRKAQLECLRGDLVLEDGSGGPARKLDDPFYWAALALSE